MFATWNCYVTLATLEFIKIDIHFEISDALLSPQTTSMSINIRKRTYSTFLVLQAILFHLSA